MATAHTALLPDGMGAAPFAPGLRATARAAFEAAGLPTRKTEDWKYTGVQALAEHRWTLAGGRAPGADHLPRVEGAARLVFVNGQYHRALSDTLDLPEGVHVSTLADSPVDAAYGTLAELDGHPFAALNTLGAQDGLQLRVARGKAAPALHLVHVAAADADEAVLLCPRVLVVAEGGAQVRIIEEFVSHGAGATAAAAVNPSPPQPGRRADPQRGAADLRRAGR